VLTPGSGTRFTPGLAVPTAGDSATTSTPAPNNARTRLISTTRSQRKLRTSAHAVVRLVAESL